MTPAYDRFCGDSVKGIRVYCHPKYFEGLPNTLYRNRGDGTFEDVSLKSGIAKYVGRGMSVAFAEKYVFVTNDNLPNFLFRNKGDGTFAEMALEAGVAMLDHGKPVASMGADFRDYDNDGLPDIAVTALFNETFPLFRNLGKGVFRDATFSSKLGMASAKHSGWGNAIADFNNDGWKDLFTANAHVNDRVELFEPAHYKEPNSLFINQGNGTFSEVAAFPGAKAHRGSAVADLDGDGKLDIVVSAIGEAAEIWHNTTENGNHWLNVKLMGSKSNRDGMGAVVRIGNQVNHMTSAVGYASSSHSGVHFGLGTVSRVDKIEVQWPSGRGQTVTDVKADQVFEIREP